MIRNAPRRIDRVALNDDLEALSAAALMTTEMLFKYDVGDTLHLRYFSPVILLMLALC